LTKWTWDFPEYSRSWAEVSEQAKKRDDYTCRSCGARGYKSERPGDAILHACHIVSRRNGGKDILSNLVTKCVRCHAREGGHGHLMANPGLKAQIKKQGKKWTF
jgi:5-methylcytosine-specific restriction endonuclease McrA